MAVRRLGLGTLADGHVVGLDEQLLNRLKGLLAGVKHTKGLRRNNLYKLHLAMLSGFAMRGHARCPNDRTDSTEIPSAAPRNGRAKAPTVGGGRGAGTGLGWGVARGPRDRTVAPDDYGRVAGTGPTDPTTCGAGGPSASAGRRPAAGDGDRPGVAGGVGVAGGTCNTRRPRVPTPLDLQEHAAFGRGTGAARPSCGTEDGGYAAA